MLLYFSRPIRIIGITFNKIIQSRVQGGIFRKRVTNLVNQQLYYKTILGIND